MKDACRAHSFGLNSMLWIFMGDMLRLSVELWISLIFSFILIPCSFPCGSSYLFFFIFPPSTADVDGCDSRLCSHWSSCSISFETWIESVLGYCPVRLCMTSSRISLNSASISFAFLSILFILRRQPSFY